MRRADRCPGSALSFHGGSALDHARPTRRTRSAQIGARPETQSRPGGRDHQRPPRSAAPRGSWPTRARRSARTHAPACATSRPSTVSGAASTRSRLPLLPNSHHPLIVGHVPQHQSPGPDHAVVANRDVIGHRRIHAHETVLANLTQTGHDDMRRDEAVVLDDRMMPDVVAAPEDDVPAELRERLNHVVLEDEAVLADAAVGPHERPGADVGRRRVPLPLGLIVQTLPEGVALSVRDGHEEFVVGRIVDALEALERNDGEIEQPVTLEVGLLHTESDHFARGVTWGVIGEILIGDLGEGTITDDDQPRLLPPHPPEPPRDAARTPRRTHTRKARQRSAFRLCYLVPTRSPNQPS